jgi:hypothetical protein
MSILTFIAPVPPKTAVIFDAFRTILKNSKMYGMTASHQAVDISGPM